jgi:hypothetical protein
MTSKDLAAMITEIAKKHLDSRNVSKFVDVAVRM